jgi:lipopolysaccharide export system permease protein
VPSRGNKPGYRPLISVLDKMIAKDFFKTLFSVWAVVVVIIVSRKFIKILDLAIDGQVSNDTLLTILGLKIVTNSITLLPAATFMALLMVLGRLYRDQEMSAIASAGGGATMLYRSVMLGVVPLTITGFLLSLYVSPWAENKIQKIMRSDESTADIRSIAAGKFSEYSRGDLVFYVESVSRDRTMQSVFVQDRKKAKLNIINAETSHFEELPGGLYMVFNNGESVHGQPGELDFVIEKFDTYAVKIEERAASAFRTPNAVATGTLWQSKLPKDVAELQDRINKPLGILLLSFLAVPLARVSPRGGVYGSVILGFLIYFSFGNLSGVMQSWLIKGKIASWPGIFWIYLLFIAIGVLLLLRWYDYRWVIGTLKKRLAR